MLKSTLNVQAASLALATCSASGTPRTDALAAKDFIPDGLWIAHSRVLERENAALREEKNLWEAKCHELIAPHYILDPCLRAQKFRDALAYHPVLSRPTITVSHLKSFLPPNVASEPRPLGTNIKTP